MTQTTLREYLLATEDSISSGRIDEAMANCQNILTYFPEALEAQRLLGEVYLAQGQLEEAQQTFEWVLTNDPENVIVYCDRALISERVSDTDTALDCYQQAYELSRGNATIRQEFNQLSARAGQQEFMFSRAGLARLYMRGDLLTQAIQEWEAVLAISPERLDARLGLLETYWREGMYDKAEQVAMQLLEEIPTCLKALLYLAHIASISNVQRSRDLLQRAESLDPELSTAMEIFTDLTASQPNDPFLDLIKREPILLDNGVPLNFRKLNGSHPAPISQKLEPVISEKSPSSLYGGWDNLDKWEAQEKQSSMLNQPVPETPTNMNWNVNAETLRNANQARPEGMDWANQPIQESTLSPNQDEQPWYQKDQFALENEREMADWHGLSNGNSSSTSWSSESIEEEPAPPAWLDTLTHNEQSQSAETAVPHSDEVLPLARSEEMPTVIITPPEETSAISSRQASPVLPTFEDEPMPFFLPSEDENEGEMGWPEWLKSLGAETLESEGSERIGLNEQATAASIAPAQEEISLLTNFPSDEPSTPNDGTDPWAALPALSANNDPWIETNKQPEWMQQLSTSDYSSAQTETTSPASAENSTPDWMQQLSTSDYSSTQNSTPDWMQQLSTQENQPAPSTTPDWMQQLSASDYSPTQENTSTPDSTPDWMRQLSGATPDWMQQFSTTSEPAVHERPALPASVDEQEERYIASLSDLERSFQATGFVPLPPGALASMARQGEEQTAQSQEEPSLSSALAQLGSFPESATTQTTNEPWWNSMLPQQGSQQSPSTAPGVPESHPEQEHQLPRLRTDDRNVETPATTLMPTTPVLPAPAPIPQPQVVRAEVTPVLTPDTDTLLDSDLETTMKRPAIKLRPIEPVAQSGYTHTNGKGHANERKQQSGERNKNGNLSNHERLVRAYQYQLNGSYDEAMQEYRLVIRNAPELLDDVISNMRALLKLNPRFSLGYRVLGDAYMRKGEYLQAMESYNKALTMAKKAHS